MIGNIGKLFGEVKKSEVKPFQDSMERLKPNEGTDVSEKVETPVLDETAEQRIAPSWEAFWDSFQTT